MCIELKIKAKHLALEPQIIRMEENKLKKQIKHLCSEDTTSRGPLQWKLDSLINHRRWNVRIEAQATHLARAYLAGKPYLSVEKRRKEHDIMFSTYIVPRILAMVTKYGDKEQRKATRDIICQWAKI